MHAREGTSGADYEGDKRLEVSQRNLPPQNTHQKTFRPAFFSRYTPRALPVPRHPTTVVTILPVTTHRSSLSQEFQWRFGASTGAFLLRLCMAAADACATAVATSLVDWSRKIEWLGGLMASSVTQSPSSPSATSTLLHNEGVYQFDSIDFVYALFSFPIRSVLG